MEHMTNKDKTCRRGARGKAQPDQEGAPPAGPARAGGISPLEYMLEGMRDPAAQTRRRDAMAKAAAPYMHARIGTEAEAGAGDAVVHVELVRFAEQGA
jgi:hypothetical protein